MAFSFSACGEQVDSASPRLHAFYYPWYGTPENDGQFIHWNHEIIGAVPPCTFPGGKNIGADFYPQGGCYSSGDSVVLHRHMRQLQQARIGVICVSWLGEDSFEGQVLPELMDVAAEYGIMVNFHLEPAVQGSIHSIGAAIKYLMENYGQHPAFYRSSETGGRGLFYVYDSHNTPPQQWARLLEPDGDLSIRGTKWDAAIVGLIVNENDPAKIEASGMDGGYAYFAVDGFSYASTTANWTRLAAWAQDSGLLFIPSVGPGYADLQIRPWNRRNQRSRNQGDYFDCMFAKAIDLDPPIISLTSFNEWHEGTQIEPAMAFSTADFTYLDYGPLTPEAYLLRTADWVGKWEQCKKGSRKTPPEREGVCGGGLQRTMVDHLAIGSDLHFSEEFSATYAAGGSGALSDGITASNNYRDGCWQGFEGVDLIVDLDLGEMKQISELRLSFLCDHSVWIFKPRSIKVEGSPDGLAYRHLATVLLENTGSEKRSFRHEEVIDIQRQQLHFLRFIIEAEKICPDDHTGLGQPAWLFIDEIQVR